MFTNPLRISQKWNSGNVCQGTATGDPIYSDKAIFIYKWNPGGTNKSEASCTLCMAEIRYYAQNKLNAINILYLSVYQNLKQLKLLTWVKCSNINVA